MLRDRWQFQIPGSRLVSAAKAKIEFHKSRFKFWTEAKAKVMEEVKSSGIEVSVSEAGDSYNTRVQGPKVMVRNDLQGKLNECHMKIVEHDEKGKKYSDWLEVLEANSNTTYSLDSEDYTFFFGK